MRSVSWGDLRSLQNRFRCHPQQPFSLQCCRTSGKATIIEGIELDFFKKIPLDISLDIFCVPLKFHFTYLKGNL